MKSKLCMSLSNSNYVNQYHYVELMTNSLRIVDGMENIYFSSDLIILDYTFVEIIQILHSKKQPSIICMIFYGYLLLLLDKHFGSPKCSCSFVDQTIFHYGKYNSDKFLDHSMGILRSIHSMHFHTLKKYSHRFQFINFGL